MKRLVKRMAAPLRHSPWLFRTIRSVSRLPHDVYKHLYFYGDISVRMEGADAFRMTHHGYQVENDLFWTGYGAGFEGAAMRLWARLAHEAQYIVDVGANTGVYSLAAGAVNPKAQILAVEPVPRIFDKLEANVALNPFSIKCAQVAASDQDGIVTLYDTFTEHSYSSSLEPSMLPSAMTRSVDVRCCRLDTLLGEHAFPRVDLIKIDVEKHEPKVLAGMSRLLSQCDPIMVIEILDQDSLAQMQQTLSPLGFRFLFIAESGGMIRGQPVTVQFGNYLVSRKEWYSSTF